MDADRITLPHPETATSRVGRLAIAAAALAALAFFVTTAVPYLRLDPGVLARYASRRAWVLVHVAAAGVALLSGPVQLWLGLSRRGTRVHRWLGRIYVFHVGIGSIAAFYLAANTDLGWGFGTGITGLAVAWTVTTFMAVAAISRGAVEQHREWMIRSYVVTFAFVTFRVAWTVLKVAGIGTLSEQLAACSWFCWAVPLLAAEVVIQGRRILAYHPPAPATTREPVHRTTISVNG
jgi:uncharacterized membrane protein